MTSPLHGGDPEFESPRAHFIHVLIAFSCFAYEQVLQLLWVVLYKDEVNFKVFMIDMYEECVALKIYDQMVVSMTQQHGDVG